MQHRAACILGVAMAMAMAASAAAQPATPQPAPGDAEMSSCLCQEQNVARLNEDVRSQSRSYDDTRRNFQALDNQVLSSRPQVNVNNAGEVDAFKRLLDQRDAAADKLAGNATRSYADAVTRYNQAVAAYNSSCAGKSFDADRLAQLRRTLSCPKP
jgi:hypothetical protein